VLKDVVQFRNVKFGSAINPEQMLFWDAVADANLDGLTGLIPHVSSGRINVNLRAPAIYHYGRTALELAADEGHIEVIRIFGPLRPDLGIECAGKNIFERVDSSPKRPQLLSVLLAVMDEQRMPLERLTQVVPPFNKVTYTPIQLESRLAELPDATFRLAQLQYQRLPLSTRVQMLTNLQDTLYGSHPLLTSLRPEERLHLLATDPTDMVRIGLTRRLRQWVGLPLANRETVLASLFQDPNADVREVFIICPDYWMGKDLKKQAQLMKCVLEQADSVTRADFIPVMPWKDLGDAERDSLVHQLVRDPDWMVRRAMALHYANWVPLVKRKDSMTTYLRHDTHSAVRQAIEASIMGTIN
jgi:hypothetical protein